MGRRAFSVVYLLCQLLVYNKLFAYVGAEEFEWDYKVPTKRKPYEISEKTAMYTQGSNVLNIAGVACLGQLDRFDQAVKTEDCKEKILDRLMSYFNWPSPSIEVARLGRATVFDQPVMAEDYRKEVIDRLMSYFNRRSSSFEEVDNPVIITEGIGEVFVQGDDICTDGVTEIEGTVPVGGSVVFGGTVRASGTVTIAGRCAPASGFSPLRIGQPLLPGPLPLLLTPPVKAPVAEVSLPEYISAPTYEIVPITDIAPLPNVALPPMVLPTVVIPAYVIPEVVLPPSEVYELDGGFGTIVLSGNDIIINGIPYIDDNFNIW